MLILLAAILLCVTSCTNVEKTKKAKCSPDAESFFPLVPGSYWKWQDSSFTGEGEQIVTEELGLPARMIFFDTVVSLERKPEGWYANVLSYISTKSTPVELRYYVDTLGFVYEGIFTSKGFSQDSLPMARTCPMNGDTMYLYGYKGNPAIYTMHGDSAFLNKLSTQMFGVVLFVYGIGEVGRASRFSAKNLIEYRIGNGPVVKKKWLMKSPDDNQ